MQRTAQLRTSADIIQLVLSLRTSWGFSQAEAAAFFHGVTANTWQRWESGTRPSRRNLHLLVWLEYLTNRANPLLLLEIQRVKNSKRELKERRNREEAELAEMRFDLLIQMKRSSTECCFVENRSATVH